MGSGAGVLSLLCMLWSIGLMSWENNDWINHFKIHCSWICPFPPCFCCCCWCFCYSPSRLLEEYSVASLFLRLFFFSIAPVPETTVTLAVVCSKVPWGKGVCVGSRPFWSRALCPSFPSRPHVHRIACVGLPECPFICCFFRPPYRSSYGLRVLTTDGIHCACRSSCWIQKKKEECCQTC